MVMPGDSVQEALGETCQLVCGNDYGVDGRAAEIAAGVADIMGPNGVQLPEVGGSLFSGFNATQAGLETGGNNTAYAAGMKPEAPTVDESAPAQDKTMTMDV